MSAVTIIPSATHGGKGPGAAVNCTEFSTLRLDLTVASVNAGAAPRLEVWIETAPSSNGPWQTIHSFEQAADASTQRVCLAGFDNYVRANWLARSQAIGTEPTCVWGIAGTSKPDA